MADTGIDAIKKQKKAERNKRYYLKHKMELQRQASTSSETELPKSKSRKLMKRITSTFIDRSTRSCICLRFRLIHVIR